MILLVPFFRASVLSADVVGYDFHTEDQLAYILESEEDLDSIHKYANGGTEKSVPDPVILDFRGDGIADGEEYVVQISETEDFSECRTVTGLVFREYEYNNPLLGEHFFWRAGSDLETIDESPVHEATVTSLAPRNIYVPGLTNVRDIGGYDSSLVPGGKIRQGLYYRGGQIDNITAEGVNVLINELGVRAEIDLRGFERAGGYRKGFEKFDYHSAVIGMSDGQDLFDAYDYSKSFRVIADAAEKPVYLHCIAGADRTGIISFMLLTVCGVSYHDAALDYLYTCFSTHGPRYQSTVLDYYERLGAYGGETKAEQAKNWMLARGVSERTVEKIRETFVEGYESEYLKKHPFEPGDVSGDGKLNAKDVTAIMKFLVGSAPEDFKADAADYNGDEKINAKDVTALMKYLVNSK